MKSQIHPACGHFETGVGGGGRGPNSLGTLCTCPSLIHWRGCIAPEYIALLPKMDCMIEWNHLRRPNAWVTIKLYINDVKCPPVSTNYVGVFELSTCSKALISLSYKAYHPSISLSQVDGHAALTHDSNSLNTGLTNKEHYRRALQSPCNIPSMIVQIRKENIKTY